MPDEFDILDPKFRSVDDIERFYSDQQNDMVLREEMRKYAMANPGEYHRLSYAAGPYIEESKRVRRDVALWRYLLRAMKGAWRPQYQLRGSCVGQGGKQGCDALMALNAIFGGGEFRGRSAVAPMYAGSRVEVGKQPGSWDGSTGFWLVKWLTQWGVVLLNELGLDEDSRWPDESFGVQWAASRSGVPAMHEDTARVRPIKQTYVVETTDEAEVVLDAGGVLIVCDRSYATGRRGRYGISPLQSGGGHCQLVWGKFYVEGQRIWNEQNSWSENWGQGEKYPHDMPDGSVNLTDRDLGRQLRSGDCHALLGIRGLDPLTDKEIFL